MKRVVVVGAGPAGMMAAIRAAKLGGEVVLLEKNKLPGRKLLLSGKGRCNLTNACELGEFLRRFGRNGDFLRDAFKRFFNKELMDFFEERGLRLKVERQLRVFPVTDASSSILDVLLKELIVCKVQVKHSVRVKDILVNDGKVTGVELVGGGVLEADDVILATGGVSYSFTGSTGEGFEMAKRLGHKIVALRPGLVPFEVKQDFVRRLEGLTLKNVCFKISDGKTSITSDIGELLFTRFGISGPLVFTASRQVSDWLLKNKQVDFELDLKPALTFEQLHARLLREFKANTKKKVSNVFKALLPSKLIEVFLVQCGIDLHKNASTVTQDERIRAVNLLKKFPLEITRCRPMEEAMVTCGGVSLKDINPRTMESRLIKGLYFAGEIMDIDADTGGFNLQAAFSTGYLAGESSVGDGSQLNREVSPKRDTSPLS